MQGLTRPNISGGTLQNSGTTTGVGTITNLGSVTNVGTIKELSNLVTGTIAAVTSVTNIVSGTLLNSGTTTGIGTITNIGSISNIGTMPAASLTLNTGTITTIVAGTQNTLGTVGTVNGGKMEVIAGTFVGTYVELTGSSTAGTTDIIVSTDVSNYRYASLQIINTWVGTVNIQTSNDNTNFLTTNYSSREASTGAVTNITGNEVYVFPVNSRYLRVRMNAFTSGTAQGILELYSHPSFPKFLNVAAIQSGAWNVTGTVAAGTITNLATGTINALATGTITGGTLQNLVSGTINALGAGTITTGTVSVTVGTVLGPNASAGTSTTAPIQIGGTTSTGTVYGIKTDTGGLLHTLQESGTVTTVTTVSNVTTGSFVQTAGTLTLGTLTNLVSGTINALAAGTITGGTLGNLNSGTITAVSNLTNGSVNILTGTLQSSGTTTGVGVVTSITNLAAGTVQSNKVPVVAGTSYGTLGTTGAAVWGTLIAASGAGTKQYVQGLSMVVAAGTVDVAITNIGVGGTTGAGVLARGQFIAGAGITKQFDPVMASGTNGTLSMWMGGAGTVWFDVQYWQGV